MDYQITEHATYTVKADSPKKALEKFLNAPDFSEFECAVDYRDVCDAEGNDVTEKAGEE